MTAPTEGPTDARKWTTYDHPDGAYSVDAHQATEDTAGVVMTPGNVSQTVAPGEWLVRTNHPDVYRVLSDDEWKEGGLKSRDGDDASTVDVSAEGDESNLYNPNDHTATEVKAYLSREDLSAEERARVEDAERQGRNRSSAFPVV